MYRFTIVPFFKNRVNTFFIRTLGCKTKSEPKLGIVFDASRFGKKFFFEVNKCHFCGMLVQDGLTKLCRRTPGDIAIPEKV